MLVVLPWSEFWEHNYFASTLPVIGSVVTNNFVRGGVTGLGVVNLAVAFAELAGLLMTRDPRAVRDVVDDAEGSGARFGDGTERPR